MFSHISGRITDNMVNDGIIASEDRELYFYGVQQGLIILLNIITTVIVGLLLGTLWQMLVFTAYPVCLPEFKAIGTNSLSTAYIAGMICKEMNNKSSYYDIYQLFIKKSQKIDVSWKKYYLKRKIENVPKHEAIIILSNMELSESSDLFLNNLKEHIINDGYTCAILLKNGLNNPSDYNFTLESSPMSSIETLDFISKLCRPSIILINSQELINYADVIIRNDEIEVYISDSQTLRFKHSTFNYLWKIIKKIFESKK